jgi:uncharacterized membrane protein
MAGKYMRFRNLRSIAGMALIGLGLFVLGGNLSDACGQLARLVGISAATTQTFGGLIGVGLAASLVWRSYLFDRRELLLGLCKVLISFWPLLLVVAGTVLTAPASRTESKNLQEKIPGLSI